MKNPLVILLAATLAVPLHAWEEREYRPINFQNPVQQVRLNFDVKPLPPGTVVTKRIDIKPIEMPPAEKPSGFLDTALAVIKAPLESIRTLFSAVMNLPVIKPIQEGLRIVTGYLTGLVTGDSYKPSNPVTFDKNGPAVMTINGVRNTPAQANEIKDFAMKVTGVKEATAIRNDSFLKGVGDLIQSFGYEVLGNLDKPVMDTYKALSQGLRENGVVIVFAHSQGTAILNQARSLLSAEENSRIEAWQIGSEWEGSHENTFNIRNPGDPIPLFNKAIVNSVLPFSENRLETDSIKGEGRGHSFHEYKDFLEKTFLKMREEKPWQNYSR